MLRIAVQSKGRLFEDTMALFTEADIKLMNNKVIIPSEDEIQRNPRSRSAKLRIAEKK